VGEDRVPDGASNGVIRVGYITGEPTPARAPQLARIAEHPEIDLTVIYAAQSIQRRQWSLQLPADTIFLRGPSLPLSRVLHHDYPITLQIWPLLERERFDVLVVAGWSVFAGQAAIAWARRRRVPYLIVSENHLREPRPFWVKGVKAVALRQVVPPSRGSLVPGVLARTHAIRYGARPEEITVFPNTVDVEVYREEAERLGDRRDEIRRGLSISEDAVVVVEVARLIPDKCIEETFAAMARARSFTSRPLHLLIVGDGPLRASLETRAARLGLTATFTGFREGEPLLECYSAADLFILLSRREPWGTVVNEAAAFGLPLVLADTVGAAADLLQPGENGALVRNGDVEGQALAIARLADDDELRERAGRRSAEIVSSWGYEPSIEPFVAAVRRAARQGR
jgi:glycosyltransferase involved in cell wall biosynthesis